MNNNKGFSLTEVIIVMAIILILATIATTVYLVQAREVSESTAYTIMQRGYENFLDQFSSDVRFARAILAEGETYNPSLDQPAPYTNTRTVNAIEVYDYTGTLVHTYEISGDTLKRDNTPFVVAGSRIKLDGATSEFTVHPFRQAVEFNGRLLDVTSDGDTLLLGHRRDYLSCRN